MVAIKDIEISNDFISEVSETLHSESDDILSRELYDLVNKIFPGKYSEKLLQDNHLKPIYVNFIDEKIVGFCFWQRYGDAYLLYLIGVDPNFRRKGVGSDMMNRSIKDFKNANSCTELIGNCRVNNPARLFHKKIGFEEDGISKSYYKNGDDAVRIKMKIGI